METVFTKEGNNNYLSYLKFFVGVEMFLLALLVFFSCYYAYGLFSNFLWVDLVSAFIMICLAITAIIRQVKLYKRAGTWFVLTFNDGLNTGISYLVIGLYLASSFGLAKVLELYFHVPAFINIFVQICLFVGLLFVSSMYIFPRYWSPFAEKFNEWYGQYLVSLRTKKKPEDL